jgi:hypothetical protein
MSRGLTRKALIKHLNKSDKEEIILEVVNLFNKFKSVKEYYTADLTSDVNPLLEKYKKKITLAYLSKNPKERTTNMNVNRLINEFQKISIYERETADLMLHRVECGVAAFRRNNNRSPTFYSCIATTFEDALKIISIDNSIDEFRKRINKILKDSKPGKCGFSERLKNILNVLL